MCHRIFVLFVLLLAALLSVCCALPLSWGPSANRGPIGGPAWNGGDAETTDNIILHSKGGKWHY
ncbi:uncharacterized protein LOC115634249 [Scaptodrosophila lebanonensis]|uniref:Uncharacterized protein LOC115634249 n=1 Tax=Drosophila lebanonensis TaxID=7225 RepID=A0A6J2UH53_DROLE|nr:uncharacterized protein LOC115634249 [Scaptodrosophila lebanonensis]